MIKRLIITTIAILLVWPDVTVFAQNDSICVPPGELGICRNENDYRFLQSRYYNKGILNSELARNQLILCNNQIQNYNDHLDVYKQCVDTQDADFYQFEIPDVADRYLKSFLCSSFISGRSKYYDDNDFCGCADGYYLIDNQQESRCVSESEFCMNKYGSNFYMEDGNCFLKNIPKIFQDFKSSNLPSEPTIIPSPINSPNSNILITIHLTPTITEPTDNFSGSLRNLNLPDERRGIKKFFDWLLKTLCFGFC